MISPELLAYRRERARQTRILIAATGLLLVAIAGLVFWALRA